MTKRVRPSRSLTLARPFVGREVEVLIDRPLGSPHPRHPDILYGVNYGYVSGTRAPDGAELDAYVLGVAGPLTQFRGRCTALIHRLDDDDDKLVVVPEGVTFSDEEIMAAVRFQERFFRSEVSRL